MFFKYFAFVDHPLLLSCLNRVKKEKTHQSYQKYIPSVAQIIKCFTGFCLKRGYRLFSRKLIKNSCLTPRFICSITEEMHGIFLICLHINGTSASNIKLHIPVTTYAG